MALDIDAITPILGSAASAALQSFPSHHDREDAVQSGWVWIYEHRPAVEQAMRVEGWEKALFYQLRQAVNAHLRVEDGHIYGYAADDLYVYSDEAIKLLLWDVWRHDDWQMSTPLGDGTDADKRKATSLANTTGDKVAMLIDIKAALSRLRPNYYEAIKALYRDLYSIEGAAHALGCSEDDIKNWHKRGVKALRRELGMKPLSELREKYYSRAQLVSSADARARLEADFS